MLIMAQMAMKSEHLTREYSGERLKSTYPT